MKLIILLPLALLGQTTVKEYIDQARRHLIANKINEAIDAYDMAIKLDSSAYLSFYGRATAFLSAGFTSKAIKDLSSVLKLNPTFSIALVERARLSLQEGDTLVAVEDYRKYLELQPGDSEATEGLEKAKIAHDSYTFATANPSCAVKADHLNVVDARMLRADCYIEANDLEMASGDLISSRAAKLRPDNTEALLKLSQIRLKLGETGECVNSLRECLKYDMDHKECKKLFRSVKKFEKEFAKLDGMYEGNSFASLVKVCATRPDSNLISQAIHLGLGGKILARLHEFVCRAYFKLGQADNTKIWCEKTLKMDENNVEALLLLAAQLVDKEEYEDAVRMYKQAHENGGDQRASEGYQKAQRLLKQAGQKNYYKVLGISRDASKREIKKAFRKLAQKWHPDKHEDKVTATKKMETINEAYDVLKDDELRMRFDNGDDPNAQQQGFGGGGGGFHPFFQNAGGFQGFHQHGGGGGFQFNFHH